VGGVRSIQIAYTVIRSQREESQLLHPRKRKPEALSLDVFKSLF
jgi:hypothetical protein